MTETDSKWNMTSEQAHKYMVDPLVAPDPSDETGLNANFRSTFAPATPPSTTSSVSPVSNESTSPPPKTRSRGTSNPVPYHQAVGSRSRGNSLTQRFPGDMSHRPLDMLKKDAKIANRSLHKKKRSIDVDTIDNLDTVPGGPFHHEGPFDATLLSRNMNPMMSPVAAVAESNYQAIKATPRENIIDSLERHKPLDGVASFPPGMEDPYGRTYDYQETNLMNEEGSDYKKYPGEDLNIDQIKKLEQEEAIPMQPYAKASGRETGADGYNDGFAKKDIEVQEDEIEGDHRSKRHSLQGLKKRIGSLRRKKE
jgi:hypothetical protein